MKPKSRILRTGCLGIIVILLLLCGASVTSNQFLPKPPQQLDRLDPLDKTRLAEALNLKAELGNSVWPGWGNLDMPVILANREYEFLVGFSSAPPGWSLIEGDDYNGQPYYRRANTNHQNFAVQVEGRWAASMATKQYTDEFLIQTFQDMLPPVIEQIFPYRLLLQPSETQIGGVLHESFHVYQAVRVPELLDKAEAAHKLESDYGAYQAAMLSAWKDEAKALQNALKARTRAEMVDAARQFLTIREQRRREAGLSQTLMNYERWLEWEEGVAKYVELGMWKAAYETEAYIPLSGMSADASFKEYQSFRSRWSQNLSELGLNAGKEGEIGLYNSGAAQAFLLDELAPGWKGQVFESGVWLEDLLAEAVK